MRGVAFTLTEALSKSRFPRRTVGFVSTILAPGEIFSNPGTVPYSKATTEVTPSVSKSFKNRLLLLGPLGLHTHKAESTAVCDCVVSRQRRWVETFAYRTIRGCDTSTISSACRDPVSGFFTSPC